MRLQVGVVGVEQRLGPLDADVLGVIDDRATAVVAPTGVALGVLVAQRGAQCGEHGRRGEVLAGDQLQARAQAVELTEDDPGDLGILSREGVEVGTPEGGIKAHGRAPGRDRGFAGRA